MNKPIVVVAESIAPAGLDTLAATAELRLAVGFDRERLLGQLGEAEGLIVRSATKVDRDLLEAAPRLRVIGRAGIGTDNIDLEAATQRGILVVNAPTANVISAAEHTLGLLLAQARSIPAADSRLRAGGWDRSGFQGVELYRKVLGVLGLGRVGSLVAERALAFGMRVLAFDPYVGEERAKRMGVELTDQLDRVLAEADFLTIHLPLTRETERLIDAAAMARMKRGVRIINTSRGGVIDELALAEAIASGQVAGAALDVFATEPTTGSPLFSLPQVVVTPHLGASTQEAQDKAGTSVAEAVAASLRGELVTSAVNVEMGRGVSEEARPYLRLAELLGHAFVGLAKGLPASLAVRAVGRLAEDPVRPLALAALKGALAAVSDTPVSFVNAPLIAAARGISVVEESAPEASDYMSLLRISGIVSGNPSAVAGVVDRRKGPTLVEVFEYRLELPLTRYLLVVRNQDVPGVIGRVGTYLGDLAVNIADMVVGRSPDGAAAMMGLSLDSALSDVQLGGMRQLSGVTDARFVDLG